MIFGVEINQHLFVYEYYIQTELIFPLSHNDIKANMGGDKKVPGSNPGMIINFGIQVHPADKTQIE